MGDILESTSAAIGCNSPMSAATLSGQEEDASDEVGAMLYICTILGLFSLGIFGLLVRYAKTASKAMTDYSTVQSVYEQMRVAKLMAGRRTITRKLALNALNTVNKCSSTESRITYV